jgi:hypothetical protein
MRRAVSPETGRRYPLTMICAVLHVPRSTAYLAIAPAPIPAGLPAKRGPKTSHSDAEVVEAIRAVPSPSAARAATPGAAQRRSRPRGDDHDDAPG